MCKEGEEEKEEESRAHKRENTHAGNHVVRTLIKKKWKDSSVNPKYNFDLQQTVILLIYVQKYFGPDRIPNNQKQKKVKTSNIV